MAKRKPQFDPRAELESRILESLRTAGGSCRRPELRKAVKPLTIFASFDEALAALAARGKVMGESVSTASVSPDGILTFRPNVIYYLGRGKPTKLPTPPDVGARRKGPAPVGEELDGRIIAALDDAGGSMDRGKLRETVDARLTAAVFDESINRLVAKRQITAEVVKRLGQGYSGWIAARATVYTLADGRKAR